MVKRSRERPGTLCCYLSQLRIKPCAGADNISGHQVLFRKYELRALDRWLSQKRMKSRHPVVVVVESYNNRDLQCARQKHPEEALQTPWLGRRIAFFEFEVKIHPMF